MAQNLTSALSTSSAAPRLGMVISAFTNCLITCVWADGMNRTPPILFTYNKAFLRALEDEGEGSEEVIQIKKLMDEYGVGKDQIVVLDAPGEGEGKYVGEGTDLVISFFDLLFGASVRRTYDCFVGP